MSSESRWWHWWLYGINTSNLALPFRVHLLLGLSCETNLVRLDLPFGIPFFKGSFIFWAENKRSSFHCQTKVNSSFFVDEGEASVNLFFLIGSHRGQIAILWQEEWIGRRNKLCFFEIGKIDEVSIIVSHFQYIVHSCRVEDWLTWWAPPLLFPRFD